MSKGLKAFNKLLGNKGISNEELDVIEKELKALEIIKRYAPDIELYHDLCCLVDSNEDLELCRKVLKDEY